MSTVGLVIGIDARARVSVGAIGSGSAQGLGALRRGRLFQPAPKASQRVFRNVL